MRLRAIVTLSFLTLLLIGLSGCSSDPPSARVLNERTGKANIQLKFQDGNTININDVAGATATNYQDINTGTCVATASLQSESVAPTASFNAEEDMNYTVVVVNSTPPSLRVDASSK